MILSQYRFIKYATQILLLKNGQLVQNTEEINEYIENSSFFHEKNSINKESIDNEASHLSQESDIKENDLFESNFLNKAINDPNDDKNSEGKNTEIHNDLKISQKSLKNTIVKNEEIREEGEIKMRTFMIYIKGMGIIFFSLIVITITMMQFFRNFFDIWLKEYVNYNTLFLIDDNFKLTLIIIALITIFWSLMRAFCFAIANLRASKNIFVKLLHSIMYSKMVFFESNAIGRIINRFSGDTQAIDDRISFESNILLNNVFILTGSLIVIIMQNLFVFISKFHFIFVILCYILRRCGFYWSFVLFYTEKI